MKPFPTLILFLLLFSACSMTYGIVKNNPISGVIGYFTMLFIVFITIREDLRRKDEN